MSFQKSVTFWSASSQWLLAGLLATAVRNAPATDFSFESAGARYGLAGNQSGHDFNQVEAFADWNLPWGWDLAPQWRLQSRLEASAGWLGDGKDAAIGTLGPNLVLRREHFPLSLVGGLSPTMLSEH
ncbi:MAG TPA: hypothetical protein VNZ22_05950, partial [Bacillota bacterium]|nr:hypothetical protein [Bacillota bacterium]